MMKVSQNLYAETLLTAIGAAQGQPATVERGRAAARAIFTGWSIAPNSYVQADGSGLSRYDYVTAEMIVRLLERLHGDPRHRDAFVATLPIAGKDGTISTRMRAHARRGQRGRQDRIDLERARAFRLRPHARRRVARLLDPRQQLHHSRGDGELDGRPGRRDTRKLYAPVTTVRARRRVRS